MLYQAYQAHADWTVPLRLGAGVLAAGLSAPGYEPMDEAARRSLASACELFAFAGLSHRRPRYGIAEVAVGGRVVAVAEEVVQQTPFCTLLRFRKDSAAEQPRVLLIAPMSGHFATLLRGTVRTMLPDHDVYLTDWHNARDVPLLAGRFGLDDFIEHLIAFTERLGSAPHLVAVCQPTVAALAAVALMAEDGSPATPRSLTLMAGPIDARISPTRVNEFATGRPIGWFERHLIGTVPLRYAGAWRPVYPGFLQLGGFMSMNFDRHFGAFIDLFRHLSKGDREKADAIRGFYDEYFAVMDLPAEFFLETVQAIFQEHALARGVLTVRGRRVDLAAIRRTALLTVEGERDDICAVGQTLAAQELCRGLPPFRKRHHVQTGVGHYGVFNGRHWAREIYPLLRETIHIAG